MSQAYKSIVERWDQQGNQGYSSKTRRIGSFVGIPLPIKGKRDKGKALKYNGRHFYLYVAEKSIMLVSNSSKKVEES